MDYFQTVNEEEGGKHEKVLAHNRDEEIEDED